MSNTIRPSARQTDQLREIRLSRHYTKHAEGSVLVEFGDTVFVAQDYSGPGGNPGRIYEFMGKSSNNLDLSQQDYSDAGYWREIVETTLVPEGLNLTDSDSVAGGGSVVHNDVRGGAAAYILNKTISGSDQLTVEALQSATITANLDENVESSGGSVWGTGTSMAVNGSIASNLILGGADAHLENVTATGFAGARIYANDDSLIEADNRSMVMSGDTSVGVKLAFNIIGWEPQGLRTVEKMEANAGGVFGAATGYGVVYLDFDALIFLEKNSRSYWVGFGIGARGVSGDPVPADVTPLWRVLVLDGGDGVMKNLKVSRVDFGGTNPNVAIERGVDVGVAILEDSFRGDFLSWE